MSQFLGLNASFISHFLIKIILSRTNLKTDMWCSGFKQCLEPIICLTFSEDLINALTAHSKASILKYVLYNHCEVFTAHTRICDTNSIFLYLSLLVTVKILIYLMSCSLFCQYIILYPFCRDSGDNGHFSLVHLMIEFFLKSKTILQTDKNVQFYLNFAKLWI